MATAFYRVGTVSVTQSSRIVTGTGTSWATGMVRPLAGDVFIFNNKIYEVEHIASDTEIRLCRNFEDATGTKKPYVIMRNASLNISSRIAAQVSQVVNQKQALITEFNDWIVSTKDSVVIHNSAGDPISLTPLAKLLKDIGDASNQLGVIRNLASQAEASKNKAEEWTGKSQQHATNAAQTKTDIQQIKTNVVAIQSDVTAKGSQASKDAATATAKAGIATTKANESNTSATKAKASESASKQVQTDVTAKGKRATQDAATATTKAGEASASASAAQASKVAAAQIKTDVKAKGAQATTDAATAKAQATIAVNQTGVATTKAAEASASANAAKVDAKLAMQERIAAEQSAGKAAASNILLTEVEARAIQAQNLERFDASGFVHYGKHYSSGKVNVPVNEGLWVDAGVENKVFMGADGGGGVGVSKTELPVVNIAGAVSYLSVNKGAYSFPFELPQAEDGTRVYNSTGNCRGSGKASLDLKKDVDPKYGNKPTGTAAQIQKEAVARAFEGGVKNGDFRVAGLNDYVADNGATLNNIGGACTIRIVQGGYGSIRQAGRPTISGKEYEISVNVDSVDASCILIAHGITSKTVTTTGRHTLRFKATGSRVDVRITSDGVPGDTVKISNLCFRPITEEIVTHPVDLLGLEYYEEELTGRQEVFECIQSLSTTFGDTDVPTVLSTRPLSYFQQYDGQFPNPTIQNSKYRCVVWSDLTDVQKRKVSAYMKEKLFVGENGNLVNGRLRARTIRGLGNGDWGNINSHASYGVDNLRFSESLYLTPQGHINAVSNVFVNNVLDAFQTDTYSQVQGAPAEQGALKAPYWNKKPIGDFAYKGRCFFYVVVTVPRVNQGAYHPSLNPWGTSKLINTTENGWANWYEASAKDAYSTAQCFKEWRSGGLIDTNAPVGSIGIGLSGRPDGKFYDAIYSGGLNGVIDWRLPAVANSSPEEAAKVEAKVENGTYRGLEKLVRTWISVEAQVYTAGAKSLAVADSSKYRLGDEINVLLNGVIQVSAIITGIRVGAIDINTAFDRQLGEHEIVVTGPTDLSVSGEFNTQMIVGDSANISQIDTLKDGWLGTWCPVIPDGVKKGTSFPFSRKLIGTTVNKALSSINNGATWSDYTTWGSYRTFDQVKNTPSDSSGVALYPQASVSVVDYKAFAKQTKLSKNKPVLGYNEGLLPVFLVSDYRPVRGGLFGESFLGRVLKSVNSHPTYEHLFLRSHNIVPTDNYLSAHNDYPLIHPPLALGAPTNNSPAVKVLPCQISNNGQASIGYQANELKWDAVAKSWGDDNKIKITSRGSDTFVDLNGKNNLSVVHELAIPYGWTSNHARAGKQVPGVDL